MSPSSGRPHRTPDRGPVVIDLGPAQSWAYRERGVARHTLDFARAMLTQHPDLVGHFLLNPRRPPVGGLDDLIAGGRAIPVDEWRGRPGGVLHLISPFELDVPLRLQWPRAASSAGMRLVVTVHDLIPEVFPDAYLADPGLRRRWRARRELIRAADHVFTLSRSGTADVVERLGVPESRVTMIGAGCSPRFRPPSGRDRGGLGDIPGLRSGFVVYNGAVEPRKNLDRLLQAWARVPQPGARPASWSLSAGWTRSNCITMRRWPKAWASATVSCLPGRWATTTWSGCTRAPI